MALADYAAPIADEQNPLLPLVRGATGVIAHRAPGRTRCTRSWRASSGTTPNEQFAYLAQRVVEHACGRRWSRDAVRLTGLPRVALAGGVASNVKATGASACSRRSRTSTSFRTWATAGWRWARRVVAASRAGRAIALDLRAPRTSGPSSTMRRSRRRFGSGARPQRVPRGRCRRGRRPARRAAGSCMWFQGRMEYGPRALGHRSVLARPDRPDLRDRLNLVLKRRVWYQPFCPEHARERGAARARRLDGPPATGS